LVTSNTPAAEPSPRWLNEREQAAWLAFVQTTSLLPQVIDRQLRRDVGITHYDYMVLVILSEADDRRLQMSEVAARSHGSMPRLSQLVRRLEDRGWVRREPDPCDGRSTWAILTDEGWAAIQQMAPGHVELVRRVVFDPLTAEQVEQLRAVSSLIGEALKNQT
jgi:DNA-binding MarR family transcriptional regulator